jgi:hypothetical protein
MLARPAGFGQEQPLRLVEFFRRFTMSSRDANELYRRVDEVLHYLWDPIGVSGIPAARDEYETYVPQVFELLNDDANRGRIAGYLNWVVTERMGLSENAEATLRVVDFLQEWKAKLTAA